MLLQDVFDQLTYGELSNSSLGEKGVSEANKPKVISQINLAVSSLYVNFKLLEKVEAITLVTGEYDYDIETLTIMGAYNEKGYPLGINDPNDPNSIFTTGWNTIQVPPTVDASKIYISYLGIPPKLDLTAEPTETTVDIPDILLEPLLAYVASRVHTIKGTTESLQEGIVLMHKYDLLCLNLKNANVLNNSIQPTNINLESNGWR